MLLIMTVLPTIMLLVGSFMKLFGQFNLDQPWTTRHWAQALTRHDLIRSFVNTMYLGIGSAFVGMALFSIVAYYVVKSGYVGRRVLDFLSWLPTVVPGIVISLAFLQMFTATGFLRPLYGTMWVLIIAVVLGSMTVGVQLVKGTIIQLNNELEEASWTSGASRSYTFLRIVLPLIAPSVIVVGLQVFATAVSVVGLVALLGTGQTQPLSILQLVYMDSGRFETATIIGLIVLVITVLAALLARYVSAKTTLGGS
jgi:iron(III) transport system permease protein